MTGTQDKVLKAIKAGYSTKKEIIKETGLNPNTVHNALSKLRKWKSIKSCWIKEAHYTDID